ncbi:Cleavage and polyadenylation specificity factor subunit 2 [Glycine soja]
MKEEELKTSHGADNDTSDPMVIDSGNNHVPPEVTGPRGRGYRDIFIDGFVPPSTSVAPIFPCYENTSEWDDFGEVINPDDYGGSDINGKLDKGAASLILDTKPSKVVSYITICS